MINEELLPGDGPLECKAMLELRAYSLHSFQDKI